MSETTDVVVLFTEGLSISNSGLSSGSAVFPFRFIRGVGSFNIVGWPNVLHLSDILEVKEEFEDTVSFCFIDGVKVVC